MCCLEQKATREYPKHIFLLTDGQVPNTREVLSLIRRERKYSSVHGIGIGGGCSQELILGCSEKSEGKHIFVSDDEDPTAKIIQLLEEAISPVIADFQLSFDPKAIEAVIPNPKEMPYILKNHPVNLYFLLKVGFEGPFQVTMDFTHPQTAKISHQEVTALVPNQSNFEFLDKKAQHKKLALLESTLKEGDTEPRDMMLAKPEDLKSYIVSESVRHQVLCPSTAFLSIQRNLKDGTVEEIQNRGRVKISVHQPTCSTFPSGFSSLVNDQMVCPTSSRLRKTSSNS